MIITCLTGIEAADYCAHQKVTWTSVYTMQQSQDLIIDELMNHLSPCPKLVGAFKFCMLIPMLVGAVGIG
eukprot:12011204-Ditylum_brightwellii.AAC.1